MKPSLDSKKIKELTRKLAKANTHFQKAYPYDAGQRQPVHTVYGGAHLFSAGLVGKFSAKSLEVMSEFAPNAQALGKILEGDNAREEIWSRVFSRVQDKLKREPVEDFRIDFEDGYGNRADAEEDGHAEKAAQETAKAMKEGTLPPFIGIRIKPFSEATVGRSVRTMDIFISTLAKETKGKLPSNFVVTLPKVTIKEQTAALAQIFKALEKKTGLKKESLKYEFMVETTQAIIGEDGTCPMRSFVDSGEGRCTGAHFGTYDYTASNGITAAYQTMDNVACDFAKQMMKVSLSGTGVFLSDGATNVMPVGSKDVVHRAWKLSFSHIRHSLEAGFYQGWDLHPAQLPIRYAAVYSFFLESLDSATERLRGFMEKAARATLLGDVFDDAATGQGLLNFFLCGLSCGAVTEEEAKATGLTLDEIQTRSFMEILNRRKG